MKSQRKRFPLFILSIIILVANACTEPTLIGSEIIDQTDISLHVQDTFSIHSTTVNGKEKELSYRYNTYTPQNPAVYMLGEIEDPVFGNAKSDLYTEFFYTSFPDSARRVDGVVDSVVFIIYPDSIYADGDLSSTFELSIHRLTEKLTGDSIYTNQNFSYNPVVLASKQFDRYNMDSVTFINDTDTVETVAQLRITLPSSLGEELMALDTANLNGLDGFSDIFPGLFVTQSDGNALMGSYRSPEVMIYYSDDTLNLTWPLTSNSIYYRKSNEFKHDLTGSVANDHITNGSTNDSIIFVQGMTGPMGKLTFPNITELETQGFIINKAELRIPVNAVTGVNGYDLPYVLGLSTFDEDEGEYELIEELSFAIGANTLALGGGVPSNEDGVVFFNISNTLSKMKAGDIPNSLYLHVLQRALSSNDRLFYSRKMILNGAANNSDPIKLVLYYTLLNG